MPDPMPERMDRARTAKQMCASEGAHLTDSGPSEYVCGAPAIGGTDGQWLHLCWHAIAEGRRDALDEAAEAVRALPRYFHIAGMYVEADVSAIKEAAEKAILALKETVTVKVSR